MPDITIVGGGPAGTYSARLLAMSGRDVTVLEDHHCAGVPTHCAGVVSSEVIGNMGVNPKVLGTMAAADVVLPDDSVISVSRSIPYAYVINRADLDMKLAESAESAGATIKYGVRYKNHVVNQDSVVVNTNTGSIKSDLLIGADGQSSLVAASLGNNLAHSYIRGYQVDLQHELDEQNKMILWLGHENAPGFFAWMLPLGDVTRVGVGISAEYGTPITYLNKLLKKTGLDGCNVSATYVGKVPLGGRRTSFADRVMLIGDAAGQVKPVSGGGLYPISIAAPHLKETVDRAYSMNIFSSSLLSLYERGWKRDLGKSISSGMRLRKFYDSLDDDELCAIGHQFARDDVREELAQIDIDDPSNVVKPILKKHGMKSFLLKTYLRNIL